MLEGDFEAVYQLPQQEGQACENDLASTHLTTATTARDMISILDTFAQTEDGKRAANPSLANYWGFSYGTVLGQTFTSMFPNRLGHCVLDSVVDPDGYVSGLQRRQVLLTDDVFSTFFLYCNKAGPDLCPFFTGSTPEDIYLRLKALVGQLNVTYAELQGWTNPSILDFSMGYVASALFEFTYRPITDFPLLAESLVNSLLSRLIQSLPSSPPQVVNEPIQPIGGTAIRCGDTRGSLFNITFQDYYGSSIQKLESQSSLACGFVAYNFNIECTYGQ
jgi:pimeloyl-ACP methyl ester carboxylesterase